MPHMDITHSRNLGEEIDLQALCDAVARAMEETGMFPLGGIRVRAIACDAYRIADGHADNMFADFVLRVGQGRPPEARKAAAQHVWDAACAHLAPLFDRPHFALSFEMREIDADFSWKKNSIHPRVTKA
ncbi:5-carboxymethyl-2-hydroxymuconate Delta-isomerase [Rhodovulum sp. DZ06]|uniref:5-carboxymethyl-2-hydroxymuconate Delta-isomerase n=1 Tax=Rhodovulum sp. DZ06 TaxID=3425126 RepID=UPI003D32D8C5